MTGLPANAVHLRTRSAWRAWLRTHHETSKGVWLISYKRATGKPRIEYDAAVEEALCVGWIDSTARTLDEERGMQYFSPRKRGSGWSRSNKVRVARLTAAGLMRPAGAACVAAARADGSWTRLDSVEALRVPEDLREALASYPNATRHFDAFPPSARRMILAWLVQAKRPDTRQRRVAEVARLAEQNVRANQPRR